MNRRSIAVAVVGVLALFGLSSPAWAGDSYERQTCETSCEKPAYPPKPPAPTPHPTPPPTALPKTGADNTSTMLAVAGGLVLVGGVTYAASRRRTKGATTA
jgi:LPXTG-motif cell wall-anchored protein